MENFKNVPAMCVNGITNLATKTDEMDKACGDINDDTYNLAGCWVI